MPEILVIGSLNMDLVVQTPRVPAAGETLAGNGFKLVPGGKGANQAVAACRAGASVKMVGCVGADVFGDAIHESLRSAGVDTSGLVTLKGQSTGVADILVEASGENRIIIIPGANAWLEEQTALAAVSKVADGGAVLLQHEVPLAVVHAVVRAAAAAGLIVCLNPAPILPIPLEVLACVDYLILNETEAEALSGIRVMGQDTARQAADKLLAGGVDKVIITVGSTGAYLLSPEREFYQPACDVTAVDTTAAGDTFTGYFMAARLQDLDDESALRLAVAAASLTVTSLGAQSSIPTRQAVELFSQVHRPELTGQKIIL